MSYTATWLWEPETLYSEGRGRKYPCGSTLLLSRAVQRHDNCENFYRRCGRAPCFQPILLSVWSSWGHWSGHNHWHCHGKRPRFYIQSHQVIMSMLKMKKSRVEGIMGPWNSTWLQEFLYKFYINLVCPEFKRYFWQNVVGKAYTYFMIFLSLPFPLC